MRTVKQFSRRVHELRRIGNSVRTWCGRHIVFAVDDAPLTFSDGSRALSVDEVALLISVLMASDTRHAPVLRGKAAERDPVERDRIRRDFARWVALRLAGSNVTVVQGPAAIGAAGQMRDAHRYLGCRACGGVAGHA